MTALQTHFTWPLASSIGSFLPKIFGCFGHHFVIVDLTDKRQSVSNVTTFFKIWYNLAPDLTVFGEKSKVSNAIESSLGT